MCLYSCWLNNSIIILVLVYTAQSYAGLTDQDIKLAYLFPWNLVGGWIKEMIPPIQSPRPLHTNQAVQSFILDIPVGYQKEPFGKAVTRLSVMVISEPQTVADNKYDPHIQDVVLRVHHADGTWQLGLPAYINSSPKSPSEIKLDIAEGAKHICSATHSQVESAYFRSHSDEQTGKRKLYDYTFRDGDSYATERLINYRKKIPLIIFKSLLSGIKESCILKRKSEKSVTMIFFGCGRGREVVIGKKTIEQNLRVPVYSHGIEILPEMVDRARVSWSDHLDQNCSVSTGDALEAESIIRKFVEAGEPDGLVVVIAIGLLSEGVLKGTYTAHRILQGIAQSPKVDMVLEARYGTHLFTYDTAKVAGWAVKRQVIPEEQLRTKPVDQTDIQKLAEVIHIFTPLPLEEQVQEVVQKHSGNVLDLSLSSHPVEIFRKIVRHHSELLFDTVDISWAYIRSGRGALKAFIDDMKTQGVNSVAVSGYEPWFQDFESELKTLSLNVVKRIDSKEDFELPSILPSLARQIWKDYQVYEEAGHISVTSEEVCPTTNITELVKFKSGNNDNVKAVQDESEYLYDPLMKISIKNTPASKKL